MPLPSKSLLAITALVSLTSCGTHLTLRPLPLYQLAAKMPFPKDRETGIVDSTVISPTDLPTLVPFALILGKYNEYGSESRLVRRMLEEAQKIKADVVYITDKKKRSEYYGGLLVGYRLDVELISFACKIGKCQVGILYDQNTMMVTGFTPNSKAQASGITEGDRLVSIDGIPFPGEKKYWLSKHYQPYLTKNPGDTCRIVWIRPGKGRMEGTVELVRNDAEKVFQAMRDWRESRLDIFKPKDEEDDFGSE